MTFFNIKYEFSSICYPFCEKKAIVIREDTQDIRKYINRSQIKQAEIVLPNLDILYDCSILEFLRIHPSYDSKDYFDFSPLYHCPEIKFLSCVNKYGSHNEFGGVIDYSKIKGLQSLFVSANANSLNFNEISTLKTLNLGGFEGENRDLSDAFSSKELDTLRLIETQIVRLKGIEQSRKMQCLYLSHNRTLKDITALRDVKSTLKALRIENCPKIEDFSVLSELENLELLELSGSNSLPNLNFIKSMKNLKTFIFNVNIENGDLTPCLDLSYVYSEKNRKHYNLKNSNLPKGLFVRGNEDIEVWRRFE